MKKLHYHGLCRGVRPSYGRPRQSVLIIGRDAWRVPPPPSVYGAVRPFVDPFFIPFRFWVFSLTRDRPTDSLTDWVRPQD